MVRTRGEMIAETRQKLIAAARRAFATQGYAEASMDEFTAQAGLTRGALYHHFGGKKGLFEAVVMQIDAEISTRLTAIDVAAASPWDGLVDSCTSYVEMALEPEVQQIMFRDGPAVLGDPSSWENTSACIAYVTAQVEACKADGLLDDTVDSEAAARLLNGATRDAAQWIANADDPPTVSDKAVETLRTLMRGMLSSRIQQDDPAVRSRLST